MYQLDLATIAAARKITAITHNYSLLQTIALARSLTALPQQVSCLGIEAASLKPGTELSAPVQQAVPILIQQIKEKITKLLKK
ncbi:MAG: hypothetical protein ACQERJ_09995 [Bacillota bacterium]